MGALFSIGAAAAQLGMHPQTLREYERQGLVTPQRTPGGTRRYGLAELARLAHVQRLTSEGLSLAGVRYVLELEDQLVAARSRVEELERQLGIAPQQQHQDARRTHQAVVTRSMSLELVHVPRQRRSPRWRNQD